MQRDVQPVGAPSTAHTYRFSFDAIAVGVVLVTSALAIITFLPIDTVPFTFTKVSILVIGMLVALACYVLARLTRGNAILPPLTLLGALWFVPSAYLLSALFSGNGFQASLFGTDIETDTLGFVLVLAVVATLTALVFRHATAYRAFFKAGAVTLGVVVLFQIICMIGSLIFPSEVSSTTNLVGSFSELGMFVGLGVILTLLALRLLKLSPRVRVALMVVGGLGLCVLVLVNASIVWALIALASFGLFVETAMTHRTLTHDEDLDGVALMLVETEQEAHAVEHRSLAAPLSVLAIALFFLIGGTTIGNALVHVFDANVVDVRPSWESTFNIGSHTYASSPLFGSGPGTFGTEWLKFRDRALNETVFWNIDFISGVGYIPTSFVTTGALGGIAWLAFLALFLSVGLRALFRRTEQEMYVRFTAVASFIGFMYVLTLAVFSVPGPVVLLVGFLCAGLFVSVLRYGGEIHERGIIFARSPRIGFVIVFCLTLLLLVSILAGYLVVTRYLSAIAYNQANTALEQNNLSAAETLIHKSLVYAPSDRAYQLEASIGIARMRDVASDTSLTATDVQLQFQEVLAKTIEAAMNATRMNTDNYQNWVMLGNVYSVIVPLKIEGAYQNAKTAYTRAVALNPTNPTLPFITAQLEIAQGNAPAAEENLVQAIALKHDFTQAIFLLSQLEVQLGKAKEALQAAEAAAYFSPNDVAVLFQVGLLRSANGSTEGGIQALSRAVELSPQYANARYFLGALYAISGEYEKAIVQIEAVAALSPENEQEVTAELAALREGKNPFPESNLGALGISETITESGTLSGQTVTAPAE